MVRNDQEWGTSWDLLLSRPPGLNRASLLGRSHAPLFSLSKWIPLLTQSTVSSTLTFIWHFSYSDAPYFVNSSSLINYFSLLQLICSINVLGRKSHGFCLAFFVRWGVGGQTDYWPTLGLAGLVSGDNQALLMGVCETSDKICLPLEQEL